MDLNALCDNIVEDDEQNAITLTKKDLIELKLHIDEVLKKIILHIDEMEKNVLKEHETTQKLLKRILEGGVINKTIKRKAVLPKYPFKSFTEFQDFEKVIETSVDKFSQLVVELTELTSNNSVIFLKTSWRKIFTDDAARHLCWQGTANKQAVRPLSVTKALKTAYCQKFPVATDEEFQKTCISFFQHAKTRWVKKIVYQNSKMQSQII